MSQTNHAGSQMNIEYQEIDASALDVIATLWDKLRKHQEVLSPNFARHYARRTWRARKAELLETPRGGALHVDVATDTETGEVVGYCVSSISPEKKGTIESIYVESHCRGKHVGDALMNRAIDWLKSKRAKTIVLDVGVGNEAVISFYRRYNFYPRTIVLQQLDRSAGK